MPNLKPNTIIPTDEEDKEIIRQALEDGTLLTDDELNQMKPMSEYPQLQHFVERNKRTKVAPKKQLTIHLNSNVVDFFKSRKGWQTEINDVLQKYVDSQCA